MTIRHTVDTITSDALDALYEQLEAAEESETQRQLATAREALTSATTRAARAEAALREVLDLLAPVVISGRTAFYQATEHPVAPDDYQRWRVALDGEQPAPAPAATQATEPAVIVGCSARALRRDIHAPHDWELQPGMDPVHCPGYWIEQP